MTRNASSRALHRSVVRLAGSSLFFLAGVVGCRGTAADIVTFDDERTLFDEACLVHADCAVGKSCELGTCVEGCTTDAQCDGDAVCNPRGQCVADAELIVERPIAVGQAVALTTDQTFYDGDVATTSVTNKSDRPIFARLEATDAFVMVDAAPFVVQPGESIEIEARLDLATVPENRRTATIRVRTDEGARNWTIEVPRPPIGHWRGTLIFAEETPLGEATLGLDLALAPDGSVSGQTFSDESLLFPRDAAITGTWDPDTLEVQLSLADVITRAPLGADDVPDNPLSRDVGRRIEFEGALDTDALLVSGTFRESLYGLTDVIPVFEGQFSLRRDGTSRGASPTVMDFHDSVEVLLPKAAWDPALDSGQCSGLATDYGIAGRLGGTMDPNAVAADCLACQGLNAACSPDQAASCADGLLSAGFNLPTEQVNGTKLGPPAKTQWDVCVSESTPIYAGDGTTCLDRDAVRCAGALYRHAVVTNGGADHLEGLLDQVAAESAMGAAVGTEYLIDAMFAYQEAAGAKVWEVERQNIESAEAILARPLSIMFAPGFAQAIKGVGPSVILEDRLGQDLAQMLDIGARFSEAWLADMRLEQRVNPGEAAAVRARISWISTWLHLQGAAMQALSDRFGADDRLFQVAQISETLRVLDDVSEQVGRELNPFGFAPDYVPLKLAARDPLLDPRRNYELIREDANLAIDFFKKELSEAEAALTLFEQNEFDIVSQTNRIEESYNQRLVSFCGADTTGGPNTAACGSEAGEVREQVLRIEIAAERLRQAEVSLSNEHETISILQDRAREEIANAEGLEMTIDMLQQDIFLIENDLDTQVSTIQASQVESQCAHLTSMAAFDAVDIAADTAAAVAEAAVEKWPKAAIVVGVTAAAGAVKIGTTFGRAAVECDQLRKEANYETEIENLQLDAARDITLINKEMDAAIRQNAVASKVADIEVEVQKSILRTFELASEVQSARLEVELAAVELKTASNSVGALVSGRDRSLAILAQDPDNPFTNARFLRLRLETGRGLQRWQNLALRAAYRTGRALEYELNRNVPLIEANLFPARSNLEIDEFMFCVDAVFQEYEENFSGIGSQLLETDISLRDDIFGFTSPVLDGTTGEEVSPAEQFAAVLTAPDRINRVGSTELNFALPLLGDSLFAMNQCDDRIESIEVAFIGDNLGDGEIGVILHRDGLSSLRRCDAADLSPDQAINAYQLDPESVAIQATAFGFRDDDVGKSFGFAGYPISGDQWRLEIPNGQYDPRNADFDIRNVRDIVLRVSHRAGTSSPNGDGFNPVCG